MQRLFIQTCVFFCTCCSLWLTKNAVVYLFAEHNQFWRLDYNVTFLTATQLVLERGLVKVTAGGVAAGGVEPSAIPPKPEITREMPSIVWDSLTEYSLFVQ